MSARFLFHKHGIPIVNPISCMVKLFCISVTQNKRGFDMKKINRLLVYITVMSVMILTLSMAVYAESSSGTIGTDISWTLDDEGNLEITGSGAVPDYSSVSSPFYRKSDIKSVTIGEGITGIGDFAFRDCSGLETVKLPQGLEYIGRSCFYQDSSLTTVNFPEGLIRIGEYSFEGDLCLESVTLPDSLQELGRNAFRDCEGLKSLHLPASLRSIPEQCFYGCTGLTSLDLPECLETIGELAFYNCNITSLDMPDGLRSILHEAFRSCSSLTSLELNDGLETIGSYAFGFCSIRSLIIPDTVTEIGYGAFASCEEMRTAKLSNNIKIIPEEAFMHCTKLRAIEIPSGVEEIMSGAFGGCTDVKNVTIPASVRKMEWAFYECFGLDEVRFEGDFPAPLNGSFYGCSLTAYYPYGNKTWTDDVLGSGYGGKVRWAGYCKTHVKGSAVKKNIKAATALKAGSYDLVTYCKQCGKEISRKTVTTPKLKATIKLSAAKKKLKKGKTYTLKVTGLAKGDSVKSFTSSKKTVATVTSKGKIKARKKGKAVITVKLRSGKTAKCRITVK